MAVPPAVAVVPLVGSAQPDIADGAPPQTLHEPARHLRHRHPVLTGWPAGLQVGGPAREELVVSHRTRAHEQGRAVFGRPQAAHDPVLRHVEIVAGLQGAVADLECPLEDEQLHGRRQPPGLLGPPARAQAHQPGARPPHVGGQDAGLQRSGDAGDRHRPDGQRGVVHPGQMGDRPVYQRRVHGGLLPLWLGLGSRFVAPGAGHLMLRRREPGIRPRRGQRRAAGWTTGS